MKAMTISDVKTLVINGKLEAAGRSESLLRYARTIVRRRKLKDPEVSLLSGMILQLEQAV